MLSTKRLIEIGSFEIPLTENDFRELGFEEHVIESYMLAPHKYPHAREELIRRAERERARRIKQG